MQEKILVDANIFASRLKSLQNDAGITSRALATHVGVSEPTVSQWRSGRHMPDRQLWERLCDFLGVEISDLFFSRLRNNLQDLKIQEPSPTYHRTDRPMLRPLTGPPEDMPEKITRAQLEAEYAYYLDRAERAGALAVAAYHQRRYLDPGQFDVFDQKPKMKPD